MTLCVPFLVDPRVVLRNTSFSCIESMSSACYADPSNEVGHQCVEVEAFSVSNLDAFRKVLCGQPIAIYFDQVNLKIDCSVIGNTDKHC